MNKIITIGREFGSGGRELGKRLSDLLGIAYYDREIITEISKRTQLAERYVREIVERRPSIMYPITVGRTLHITGGDYMIHQHASVYTAQANVLREMAEASDCIIVGRCADFILRDFSPMRLFIYADMDTKIARCRQKGEDNDLSDKGLRKKILQVDKHRAKYYQYYTGQKWGVREHYDLCVNTSAAPIKDIALSLAHLLKNEE